MQPFGMGLFLLPLLLGMMRVAVSQEVSKLSEAVAASVDASTMRGRSDSEELGRRHESGDVAASEESDVRNVVVGSGPCPGRTETEAREEAAARADRKMAEALQELARERTGMRLSDRQAWLEWDWLLRQPGVEQDIRQSCEAKEYGPVATQEIRLSLPRQVLTEWTDRLKQAAMLRRQAQLFGGIGTIFLAVAALLTILVLDRRTGGYYRGWVVSIVCLGFGLLTGAVWVWLLWAF
ncbi:MAG: hypothetical protein Kow0040_32000 [Thermogutta sp.]